MFVSLETVRLFLPELVLLLSATVIVVVGAFIHNRAVSHLAALAAFVIAGILLAGVSAPQSDVLTSGPLIEDGMALSLRWLLIIAGVFFTSMSWQASSREWGAEQISLVMFAVAGTMIAVSANDLILLFLGLELISIPTYVLLFIGKRNRDAAEASSKYFFLSIASSGVLLYGLSFLYGLGQTTHLIGDGAIRVALTNLGDSPLVGLAPVALLLTIAGLGFKLTAVPFHFYAPDVYQGTTATNAALLATLPKIAAAVAIVRIVTQAMPLEAGHAWQVLLILSCLSMTIGNVCALWQTNVRRMMAYSSIAHSGYILIGMTVAQAGAAMDPGVSSRGVTAVIFYLIVYSLASIGSFAALLSMGRNQAEANTLDDLAGTGRTHPVAAAALAIFMFSLAGLPPLAGFWGKFTLFSAALNMANHTIDPASTWLIGMTVVGALNAAIAAAYYLRVIGAMYFQPSSGVQSDNVPGGALATTIACAVLTVAAGAFPSSVMRGANTAEEDFQRVLAMPSVAKVAAEQKSSPRVAASK